jgi:hypothetical protein
MLDRYGDHLGVTGEFNNLQVKDSEGLQAKRWGRHQYMLLS